MKSDLIQSLTSDFESTTHLADDVEFWYARDIQTLLGYSEWRNFTLVVEKAKVACKNAGQDIADHELGSGSQREIEDIMLTRYACYLIAQNGEYSRVLHQPVRSCFSMFFPHKSISS